VPAGFGLVRLAWRDLRASGAQLWVLCACLALGVTLIAASGGLFQQVSRGLLADTRALFGGDLEVRTRAPLRAQELAWMRARGEVSLLMEFRTMLRTPDGRLQLVALQSYDDAYPLYGEVRRALRAEYALIAVLTSLFAVPLGSAIAIALLRYRLELPAEPAWGLAIAIALGASILSLTLGAR